MIIKKSFFTAFPVLLLLIFPETSIQTSYALEKKICHTIYLCKGYLGLGIADWIIVMMAIILMAVTFLNNERLYIYKTSTFCKITLVSIVYLIIGVAYNIFVQIDFFAYLYDFKVFLYFVVTYCWFKLFCKFQFFSKNIIFIFLIIAIGSLWDYVYVHYFGKNERPNLISFMPVIQPLIEVHFLILLILCFKKYRLWLSFILIFEILSIFNQASLGQMYNLVAAVLITFLYQHKFKENLLITILIFSFLLFYFVLPLIMYEILPFMTDIKESGLDIRKMKTLSAWDNYFMNFPVIIGKGLGATYFETITSNYSNVYSTGIHHTEGSVKFILHSPLSIFYKFGLIGAFIMIFILIKTSVKLFKLPEFRNDNLAKFTSFCYPVFILLALIAPGILKNAILAAIIIFITDEQMFKLNKKHSFDKK